MKVNNQTLLASVLKEGYHGRAVEMLSTYAKHTALSKLRASIEDRVRVTSGPLYDGEAEAVLLDTLIRALRKATSDVTGAWVTRYAYQTCAAYSLIFDISKISQSKDIAKEVTQASIQAQPIVQLFQDRIDRLVKAKEVGKPSDERNMLWWNINTMLTKGIAYDVTTVGSEVKTPMEIVAMAASPYAITDVKSNTVDVFGTMLSTLRHGKGTPLDRAGRKRHMLQISEVLRRIDYLIAQADKVVSVAGTNVLGEDVSITVSENTAFSDAYTAMYWLKLYLDAVDQYDVIFPASDLMIQSQAWVLTIKTQAAKMRKLFMDIAHVSISFDVESAILSWDEVERFYDPVLNHHNSVINDMKSLWDENVSRATKLLSPFAVTMAKECVSGLKKYVDADYLLPEENFRIASQLIESWTKPVPTNGQYLSRTGEDVVSAIDTVGEMPISVTDRDLIIPALGRAAGVVEDALAFIKRSRELLNLAEDTEDIYHALIPAGETWVAPYVLEGGITDMRQADFQRHDPMQLAYEKYDVAISADNKGKYIASLQWKFTPLLMKPFYRILQLQQFTQARTTNSRVIWPGIGELPVADVIAAAYTAQPLPATYTASRNLNFIPNDMASYTTLMSGRSGITMASRDMFRKIAAVLDKFPNTYARGILDALAGTMFVYANKGDQGWKMLDPFCPTIYGLPLAIMKEWNKVSVEADKDEELGRRRNIIRLDNGNKYAFVLHNAVPEAGELTYFAYPYAKGVYLHVPLLKSVAEANADKLNSIIKTFDMSKATAENALVDGEDLDAYVATVQALTKAGGVKKAPVLGWAPYLVNLPHLLFDFQPEETLIMNDTSYDKYALLSVQVRYDEVERAIYVAGFITNPVELLDISDYEAAHKAEDPSPLPPSPTSAPQSADPEPTEEVKRSQAEQAPDPTTIGAAPRGDDGKVIEGQQRENVRAITDAPLVEGNTLHAPEAITPATPIVKPNKAAEPAAGDPAPQAKEGDDATRHVEKYWKKLDGAEVVDVVKSDVCPEGYVPASEEDYRNFAIKKAAAGEATIKE